MKFFAAFACIGSAVAVSWFPPASRPVAVSSPAPGARLAPTDPIRLTFSKPVAGVLAGAQPRLLPSTPGRWRQTDSHTLVFVPSATVTGTVTFTGLRNTVPSGPNT